MRALLASAPVAAAILLTACGSAPSPTVDATAPTVSLVPAPGDQNVWVRDPITMTFSEPVVKPSDKALTLRLTGGGSGSGSIDTTTVPSPDHKTLTVIPNSLPPPGTQVTAVFHEEITDLAGNTATMPEWTWTVPQWQHLAPPLEVGGDGMIYVETAAAPDGSLFLVRQFGVMDLASWSQLFHTASGAWTHLGTLPQLSSQGMSPLVGCSIVVGADGAPIVAQRTWTELYVERFDGSAWQLLGAPLTGATNVFPVPRLVLDSKGHPVLAWYDSDAQGVFVARWDGTAWNQQEVMFGKVTSLDIATRSGEALSLAATDGSTLQVVRFDGTNWVSHMGVAQAVAQLSLAFDENGTEVVACLDTSGAVHVRKCTGTEMEPSFTEIGTSPSGAARGVAIRARPGGSPGKRLVLSFVEAGPRVYTLTDNAWRSIADEIASPGHALFRYADIASRVLAVSSDDELTYAWAEETSMYGVQLFAVRYNE